MRSLAVAINQYFDSPISRIGLGGLVFLILSNAIFIASIILLFMLVFAGFSIMMGAGQSDPQKVAKGKEVATAAIVGFIIIFTAYWIIQLIEMVTGVQILQSTL